jgi:peptidoglycan/LPS O-acetylase OafA/YrhL
MNRHVANGYRKDIDGLRAIAVLAVILFHFGYLPNGYLGVDVFFVISGYLITSIVFQEVVENRFSIVQFYLRRIRRIMPLALFTTSAAFIAGAFVMLPDDFENLSESVVATNCFANNILLLITTGNYWDVVNEYKPLMHTWSLGVEEQFYFCYPLLFWLFKGGNKRWILPVLSLLAAISLALYLFTSTDAAKFYSIQFRFFELALGGLGAITFKNKTIDGKSKALSLALVVMLLAAQFDVPSWLSDWPTAHLTRLKLLSIVIATLGVLLPGGERQGVYTCILENRVMVGVGAISFSLYMWHQIVLAFTRYCVLDSYTAVQAAALFCVMVVLSVASYFVVEQPFRDKKRVKVSLLLCSTGSLFIVSTGLAFYCYSRAGVIRDVPELEIVKSNVHRNMHAQYNSRIHNFDRDFGDSDRIKVLVIGNSFGRDWANVLLESSYAPLIDLSYCSDLRECKNAAQRLNQAKYVFFSEAGRPQVEPVLQKHGVDPEKVWNVGTKNFGVNNGIFYNLRNSPDYCSLRTHMEQGVWQRNERLKEQWGAKYIDLVGMVIDKHGMVPVFTPECRFISQDCRHLTHAGAVYFAGLLRTHARFKFE